MLARYMREKADRPVRYAVDNRAARNFLGMQSISRHIGGSGSLRAHSVSLGRYLQHPLIAEALRDYLDTYDPGPLGVLNDLIEDHAGGRAELPPFGPLQDMLRLLGAVQAAGNDPGSVVHAYGPGRLPVARDSAMRHLNEGLPPRTPSGRGKRRSTLEILGLVRGVHPLLAQAHEQLQAGDLEGLLPAYTGAVNAYNAMSPYDMHRDPTTVGRLLDVSSGASSAAGISGVRRVLGD